MNVALVRNQTLNLDGMASCPLGRGHVPAHRAEWGLTRRINAQCANISRDLDRLVGKRSS